MRSDVVTATRPRRLAGAALLLALLTLCAACGSSGGQNLASCGNGRIDDGERCDDGNTIDEDDCTAVCQVAVCGDGAIHAGVEACDGTNLGTGSVTCEALGYANGDDENRFPACASCSLDPSPCGAAFTPTPVVPTATATSTPTATPSPSPTPTLPPDSCGDGLLEQGETCQSCPADCQAAACTPNGTTVTFAVTAQASRPAAQVRVQLAYRSSTISIPGSGSDTSVRQRVRPAPPVPQTFQVNDLDYAVDITSALPAGLPATFATVRFDACSGAPAATVDDLTCFLETCADAAGPISGCACSVEAR